MKKAAFILMSLLLMCSCEEWFPDEEFTLIREDYTGNQIRTDGYFKLENGKYAENNKDTSILFFYDNGIVFFSSTLNIVDTNKLNYWKSIYYSWGVFSIENDSIYIQYKFNPGTLHKYVYTIVANIENDSTIHFCYTKSNIIGVLRNDEKFGFKQFSPKPDSTNIFIK